MTSNQDLNGRRRRTTRRSRDEGVRRAEILDAAVDRFGRNGYENTKWADIADDVGIGPTALYHYFDSKQHCLYVILGEALAELHDRFDAITADAGPQGVSQARIDHLGEASKLFLDTLGLLDQDACIP